MESANKQLHKLKQCSCCPAKRRLYQKLFMLQNLSWARKYRRVPGMYAPCLKARRMSRRSPPNPWEAVSTFCRTRLTREQLNALFDESSSEDEENVYVPSQFIRSVRTPPLPASVEPEAVAAAEEPEFQLQCKR